MAEVLLFHHAHGLTSGVHDFAGELSRAGHTVSVPDLFEGLTFDTVEAGVAHARKIGFDAVVERGRLSAANLPDGLVLAGFSLGVLPAQMLAQNHPGALGALLYHGCVPTSEFGGRWPDGVPVQVHAMDGDPFFAEDVDAARALVATAEDAELFLYPGDRHLFTDNSLPDHDEAATALVLEHTLAFLAAVDERAERGGRS